MTTSTLLSADKIQVLPGTQERTTTVSGSWRQSRQPPATAVAVRGRRGVRSRIRSTLHCHRDEDELVVVLDGEVEFRSGDTEIVATTGACAYSCIEGNSGRGGDLRAKIESERALSICE